MQNFLNGNSQNKVPYLFCGDKWLEKLQRTDEVWDANRDPIMVGYENEYESEGGVGHPISISDVEAYAKYLFTDPDTRKEPNNRTPYWSDDLKEYVFDEDYGKKTYCTFVGEDGSMNLGAAQDNTLKGATITLCPLSFTNPAASANLGSTKPVKDISIETILPRSGTFYHELFHLVLGTADTPDLTCESQSHTISSKQLTG